MSDEAKEAGEEAAETVAELADESSEPVTSEEQSIDELLAEWGNGPGNGKSDSEDSEAPDEAESSDDPWLDIHESLGKTDEQQGYELRSAVDTDKKVDEIMAWATNVNEQFQTYRDGQDFSRVLSDVQLSLDRPDISSEFIETHFATQAQQRPAIATAWVERHQNPKAWALVQQEMTTRLNKQLPELPVNDNEQRAAAMAFVRGSSTKETPKPEVTEKQMSAMSDQEFNEYQKSLGVNP